MELPPEILIDRIDSPCICHFKESDHHENTPPHFYVIIPVNDVTDLIFSIITSKVEKREKYYSIKNPKAVNSLVKIDPAIFSFLSKDSVIDCNQTQIFSKNEFKNKINRKHNFIIKSANITFSLLSEIKVAIKNSPLVKGSIKKLI